MNEQVNEIVGELDPTQKRCDGCNKYFQSDDVAMDWQNRELCDKCYAHEYDVHVNNIVGELDPNQFKCTNPDCNEYLPVDYNDKCPCCERKYSNWKLNRTGEWIIEWKIHLN